MYRSSTCKRKFHQKLIVKFHTLQILMLEIFFFLSTFLEITNVVRNQTNALNWAIFLLFPSLLLTPEDAASSQTSGSRLRRTRTKQSKDPCPTVKVLGEVLFWGLKKCVTSVIWCNILDEVPFTDEMLSWTSWTNVTLASWAMYLI